MRTKTTTPALAKGNLLKRKLTVGEITLPPGKIIGKEEIVLLNKAGIASIEVVAVGLQDLLANPALDRIGAGLAGAGLKNTLAHAGTGTVIAQQPGLLVYPQAVLGTVLQGTRKQLQLKIAANYSPVTRGTICANLVAKQILYPREEIAALVATLPQLEIRKPKQLAIYCNQASAAITKACELFHSKLVASLASADLCIFLASDVNQVAQKHKVSVLGTPTARWLAGTRKGKPVIVLAANLKRLPTAVLRLLFMVHVGIKLDATSLSAATATAKIFTNG